MPADAAIFSKPRAILFDWDNTLVDSWGTIHEALVLTFTAMGVPPWSLEETRVRVRHSLRDSFPRLFGDAWDDARRLYLENFEAIHLDRLSPLPGSAALLKALHETGLYMAVVSNKTGRLLRREVAVLGWEAMFVQVVGAGDAAADKPDRAPVDMALQGSGIEPGRDVWFIGDTDIDMACAANAGCVPVLVGADAGDLDSFVVPPELWVQDCFALQRAAISSSHLQYIAGVNKLTKTSST